MKKKQKASKTHRTARAHNIAGENLIDLPVSSTKADTGSAGQPAGFGR